MSDNIILKGDDGSTLKITAPSATSFVFKPPAVPKFIFGGVIGPQGVAGGVITVAGRSGNVVLAESDITGLVADLAAKATLASPAFTGIPTAPTATAGTNTTQLATTAFVLANSGIVSSVTNVDGTITVSGTGTNPIVSLTIPVTIAHGGTGSIIQNFVDLTTSQSVGGTKTFTAATTVNVGNANAFDVGPNGSTNPTFNIDTSTASSATGINIKSAAAAAGVAISVLSSGTNENLTINAKGSGNITLGSVSTGAVVADNRLSVTTASSIALAVGAGGSVNPALNVDSSTASAATGLNIKSAAAASGLAVSVISSGTNESMTLDGKGTGTIGINTISTTSGLVTLGNSTSNGGVTMYGAVSMNSATVISTGNANALAIGRNGSTNPTFIVDPSTVSSATGLNIKSAAAGSGLAVSTISSGTNENLTIASKGSGQITLNPNSTGTGAINIGGSSNGIGVNVYGPTNGLSNSATALTVGPNGTTNPSFKVDASTTSAVTGLNIKSAAAAAGVAISVISSGTNENMTLDAKGSGTISIGSISTGGITISSLTLTNDLTVGNGGTGNNSLTAYAILAGGTTSTGALQQVSGLGTSGWVLTSNGAGALPTWQVAGGGSTGISGATANGAMYALGATTATSTGALTNGQLLIGSTSATPVAATLTAGSNITITNAAGSITIAQTTAGLTNPMTTLGDIIYENATPTVARLAGNTSATLAVLTQTGTGTVSAAPVWTTSTGTGSVVLATSPNLTTPSLGVATATSINKVTITAPTTSATLTLVTGSSLITTGAFALTLASSASTTVTLPSTSSTMARTDAAQTFTGVQTFSSAPVLSTNTLTSAAALLTLPTTADTLVGRATTDTLTNKTLTNPVINQFSTASGLGAAWIDYSGSITFTNFSLGNGTINIAKYQQYGKTVVGRISVTLGSTSTVTGIITFSLPVASVSGYTTQTDLLGEGFLKQTGTSNWKGSCIWISTTTASLWRVVNNGGDIDMEATASNQPFTWVSTDVFGCFFMYEAA